MNSETNKPKPVVTSVENDTRDRCVDFLVHSDGSVAYREFRRDPEDEGRWTMICDYPEPRHPTIDTAAAHAKARIGWLKDTISQMSARGKVGGKLR